MFATMAQQMDALQQMRSPRAAHGAVETEQAIALYRQSRRQAVAAERWSWLTRSARSLTDLGTAATAQNGKDEGIREVALNAIVGSEGRCSDFDTRFRPTQEHTRDRWISVASAWLRGVALPPVSLVRVGEHYYVRDGHHRISVASALGREYIDAEVVGWEYSQTAGERGE